MGPTHADPVLVALVFLSLYEFCSVDLEGIAFPVLSIFFGSYSLPASLLYRLSPPNNGKGLLHGKRKFCRVLELSLEVFF